ncbi:ribosomal protein S18-alanine N-acetyltransferase [Celeribacter litoreus]|uniref:ribosomal protein S18-alanine N-acetyltransferase n=1 Tax=Celeribacter litoreus TaxID=2876714 RepID=UPI001CC9D4A6|nr:ribosomal protein S18-alanine N-acetyltransferase [Celeribacter litoreus]MCA0042676.1 ribosomal protein S18-alanine N-acetyltransferase [Celeribacter litoreus]
MSGLTTEAIAAIHAACFTMPRPWSAKEFEDLLSMKEVFFVAGPNGAFALGRAVLDEAELLTIAVPPDAQGQGYGRTTLRAYEDAARAHGAETSFLEVAATNAPAISLYRSEGYSESGLRKNYYTAPDSSKYDALIFAKRLKPPVSD